MVMKNSELPRCVWPRRMDSSIKPGVIVLDLWDEKHGCQYCRVELEVDTSSSSAVLKVLDEWTDGLRADNVI